MAQVWIVDDDQDFASAVAMVVRGLGHETHLRWSPEGVLEELATGPCDLLILDVMFPEDKTAGFRLGRQVRRRLPDLPILMVTAIHAHQPLGFSDAAAGEGDSVDVPGAVFLEKPVDLDELGRIVTDLLAGETQ